MSYLATNQPLIDFAYSQASSSAFRNAAANSRLHLIGAAAGKIRRLKVTSMRAVVQRVASASIEVEGRIVSAIGPGLLVLVGLHASDLDSDADFICRKVLNMRLFPNEKSGKPWDLSGNKPDFHVAMSPDKARPFYDSVVEKFRKAYRPDSVKDGIFGAMMKVSLVNDGPVTMQLDSTQPSREVNAPQCTTATGSQQPRNGNGEVETS